MWKVEAETAAVENSFLFHTEGETRIRPTAPLRGAFHKQQRLLILFLKIFYLSFYPEKNVSEESI
jgi:hypothetical protein